MNQQDKDAIEKRAWDLQVEFWDHCVSDTTARPDPFCATDPGLLANFLGIQHIELPEIRNDFQSKNHSEIGGAFDRQQNLIATSLKFSNKVRRFTLAHEIAHSILHTEQAMFRDIPIGEPDAGRPLLEQQADHFAACILMPRRLVREQFKDRFGEPPIQVTDLTGHALGLSDTDMKRFLWPRDLEREIVLANAHRDIQGRQIYTLCDVFQVSTKAMAIRINELNLVRYP